MISKKVQDKGEPINSGLFLQARYSPTADNPGARLQKNNPVLSELQLGEKNLCVLCGLLFLMVNLGWRGVA